MRRGNRVELDVWPAFTDFITSTLFIVLVVVFMIIACFVFEMTQQASAAAKAQQRMEDVQQQLQAMKDAQKQAEEAARKRANTVLERQQRVKEALMRPIPRGGLGLKDSQFHTDGQIQSIVLQNKAGSGGILFDKGAADLRPEAKQRLKALSRILREHASDIDHIQVVGHTDDDPIGGAQFPSNWELSSARACSVIRYLLNDTGLHLQRPWRISATGQGEYNPFDPGGTRDKPGYNPHYARNPRGGADWDYIVRSNGTSALQQSNRRIELQLFYSDVR